MENLRSRTTAGVLYVTSLILVLVTTYLVIRYPLALGEGGDQVFLMAILPSMLIYPAVGALVAWRHPRLSLGWLYLGVGNAITVSIFVQC